MQLAVTSGAKYYKKGIYIFLIVCLVFKVGLSCMFNQSRDMSVPCCPSTRALDQLDASRNVAEFLKPRHIDARCEQMILLLQEDASIL